MASVAREKTFQKGDRIALDIEDLAVGGKGIAKATTGRPAEGPPVKECCGQSHLYKLI